MQMNLKWAGIAALALSLSACANLNLFKDSAPPAAAPAPISTAPPGPTGAVRPAMVEALRVCKRRFKVGCITNNVARGPAAVDEGASPTAAIMGLFDAVIESSKVGLRKPDPRIYRMMCEALDVAPGACVYLDDLGINCKPAAALGMMAIKFVGAAQALADLERATGLTFPRFAEAVA